MITRDSMCLFVVMSKRFLVTSAKTFTSKPVVAYLPDIQFAYSLSSFVEPNLFVAPRDDNETPIEHSSLNRLESAHHDQLNSNEDSQ